METDKKVVLVTGASSGIGRATVLRFANNGARVAGIARTLAQLQTLRQQVEADGGDCLIFTADVTGESACRQAVTEVVETFGRLDVLVNAAGIFATGSIESTTPAAWRQMLDVNLNAAFLLMQLAVPYLERTRGSIINVSSVTGQRAFPNILAYCVSKAALDHLTRCSALELAAKGIRVNAVNPGVVVTNLHRAGGMDASRYDAFLQHSQTTHPLGRPGTAEEIADAIFYLASEQASWITGITLNIDGGRQLTCAR